jgi:hypothetical protein
MPMPPTMPPQRKNKTNQSVIPPATIVANLQHLLDANVTLRQYEVRLLATWHWFEGELSSWL